MTSRHRPIRDPHAAARLVQNDVTPAMRRRLGHAAAMGDVTLPGRDGWLKAVAERLYRGADTAADRRSLASVLSNGELLHRR